MPTPSIPTYILAAALLATSAAAQPASVQALTPRLGSSFRVQRTLTYGPTLHPPFTRSVETFRRDVVASSRLDYAVRDTALSTIHDGVEQSDPGSRAGLDSNPPRLLSYHLLIYTVSSFPVSMPDSTPERPAFVLRTTTQTCDATAIDAFFDPLGATPTATLGCTMNIDQSGPSPSVLETQATYHDRGPAQVQVAGTLVPVRRLEVVVQRGQTVSTFIYDLDLARGLPVKIDEISLLRGKLLYLVHTELLDLPPLAVDP